MKKIILALAFVVCSTTVFSQVKLRPGVKLGLNASTLTNADFADRKIGINAGTFLNVHFSKIYELQVELNYSDQGFKRKNYISYSGFGGTPLVVNGGDFSIQYLNFTIANKIFFVPNIGIHAVLGPGFDVVVSDDLGGDLASVDFSLTGGIGYQFPFGLGVEARYKQGFIDVDDIDNGSGAYFDDSFLNSVIQLGVYYRFEF